MVDLAPSGEQLVDLLRARGVERPRLDPGLARHLRARLEAAAMASAQLADGVVVRLSKGSLRKVLLCERHLVASMSTSPAATPEMVRGQLLDLVFSQLVAGCALGREPVKDALAAARVSGDDRLALDWAALRPDDREELEYTVPVLAAELASRWPVLPGNAWVRLQDKLTVSLAGAKVVLSGRIDLALGHPGAERVGTTLIDVKSGNRRHDDQQDAAWYALLETLRSRAAPFQVGNYYLQDGGLHLEVVTDEMLEHQAERVAEGIARMIRLQGGGDAGATPSGLCPWCPVLDRCPPGRRHAEDRGVTIDEAGDDEDEDDDGHGTA